MNTPVWHDDGRLFVMADTHLSFSADKPMDIFGSRWRSYMKKIEARWRETVTERDTVIIPGDVSWAMTLKEAEQDLLFLESLPGQKIISKGNHDFWWSTAKKLEEFFLENGVHTIHLLYNNAFLLGDRVICGSRGWFSDEKAAPDDTDYRKIVTRECQRLAMSLDAGLTLCHDAYPDIGALQDEKKAEEKQRRAALRQAYSEARAAAKAAEEAGDIGETAVRQRLLCEMEEKLREFEQGRMPTAWPETPFAPYPMEPIVFLHFPPVYKSYLCRDIVDVLHRYGVGRCYFGHIHSVYDFPKTVSFEGIDFVCIASDYLDFTPHPVEIRKKTENGWF